MALAIAASTFGFAWSSSIPNADSGGLIWIKPQYTIFIINLLSQLTVIFLDNLLIVACDNLRWRLCTRSVGVKLLDFLALAGPTSPLGLVQLLFAGGPENTKARGLTDRFKQASYRHWSAQRYNPLRVLLI